MEINEFLQWEQQSRDTIDLKRCYVDIAGDLVAGILLSQIIYWYLPDKTGKTKLRVKDKKGEIWLAKNQGDWQKECRITVKQYQRAIKILEKKGFVKVKNSMFSGKKTPFIALNLKNIIKAIKRLNKNEIKEKEKVEKKPIITKSNNRLYSKVTTDCNQTARPITEKTTDKTSKKTNSIYLSEFSKKNSHRGINKSTEKKKLKNTEKEKSILFQPKRKTKPSAPVLGPKFSDWKSVDQIKKEYVEFCKKRGKMQIFARFKSDAEKEIPISLISCSGATFASMVIDIMDNYKRINPSAETLWYNDLQIQAVEWMLQSDKVGLSACFSFVEAIEFLDKLDGRDIMDLDDDDLAKIDKDVLAIAEYMNTTKIPNCETPVRVKNELKKMDRLRKDYFVSKYMAGEDKKKKEGESK